MIRLPFATHSLNRSYRSCDACRTTAVLSYIWSAFVNSDPGYWCLVIAVSFVSWFRLYDYVTVCNCSVCSWKFLKMSWSVFVRVVLVDRTRWSRCQKEWHRLVPMSLPVLMSILLLHCRYLVHLFCNFYATNLIISKLYCDKNNFYMYDSVSIIDTWSIFCSVYITLVLTLLTYEIPSFW